MALSMVTDKTNHAPPRSVRVPDPLWEAALSKARSQGDTLSGVIVAHLEKYVSEEPGEQIAQEA